MGGESRQAQPIHTGLLPSIPKIVLALLQVTTCYAFAFSLLFHELVTRRPPGSGAVVRTYVLWVCRSRQVAEKACGVEMRGDFLVLQGASSTYHQHQGDFRVAEVPRRLQLKLA